MEDYDECGHMTRSGEQHKDRTDDPDLNDDPRFCSYDEMERAHEEELARLFRTTGLSAGPVLGDDDEEESEGEEEGF